MLSIHTFAAHFTFATNVSFSTVCFAIYLLAQKNSFIDIAIVKVDRWMKKVFKRYNLPEKCHSFDMLADLCRELVDMVKLFSYQIYSPIQPYKSLLNFKNNVLMIPIRSGEKTKKSSEILPTYNLVSMFGWIYAFRIARVPNRIFDRLLLVQRPGTWTVRSKRLFVYWIPFGLNSFAPKKTTSLKWIV